MSNVLVNEDSMKAIANAIREKNGADASYKPREMAEAIMEISTYSGEGADPNKPVRFYGLNGKLEYSFTLREAQELKELPPLPEEKGLIGQEWNWSLESVNNADHEVEIGATFTTDDGSTRIYIDLLSASLNIMLGFSQDKANGVKVDWGDDSALETSPTAGLHLLAQISHQYAEPGSYVIRLIPDEGVKINLRGEDSKTAIIRGLNEEDDKDFSFASVIKKIEVGKGVERLYYDSFVMPCLENVTLPNNVITMDASFERCGGLRYLTLPRGITKLPSRAFSGCASLEQIILPDTMTEFGASCFSACNLMRFISLPNSLQKWYSYAFSPCDSLRKLIVPKSVTSLCGSMVYGCCALKEVILHDGITETETSVFSMCDFLEKITLPKNLTKIANQLFSGCESLREIEIPDNVTEIGMNAFSSCYSLAEMRVPESVSVIGQNAFGSCYGIKNYYFYSKEPPVLSNTNTFQYIRPSCRIHVPKGCLEAYQTAEYWSNWASYMVEMEE